jgi:hypothetical protein
MFDILFPLDGLISRIINFEMHETVNSVSLCVAVNNFIFMLIDAADEIIRHANVQSAARTTRKNVNVELPHALSFANRDGRDKPGHDGAESMTA